MVQHIDDISKVEKSSIGELSSTAVVVPRIEYSQKDLLPQTFVLPCFSSIITTMLVKFEQSVTCE